MTFELTIAIPTYNRPDEVFKTVTNLITQLNTFVNNTEVQIVVCDNSSEINWKLKKFNNYPSFKYIHNGVNLGQGKNVNKLFIESDGIYVWVLADDDSISAHAISTICEEIKSRKFKLNEIAFVTFYTGDKKSSNLWINQPELERLTSSNTFLNTSWPHPIFISNNVLDREKTIRLINQYNLDVLINDTYQNSVLSFMQICSSKHVWVIPQTLVWDSHRDKFYQVSQGFRVKVFDLMKLRSTLAKCTQNKLFLKQLNKTVISSSVVWGFVFTQLSRQLKQQIIYTKNMKIKELLFRYRFLLLVFIVMRYKFIWELFYFFLKLFKPAVAINIRNESQNYLKQSKFNFIHQTYD
jgi:glycosyltransferase involved in cell wall biosynthesis